MITLIVHTDSIEDTQRVNDFALDLGCLTVAILDGKVTTLPPSGSDS